ncbi:2-(1,2-epoxy-1,2-dihydrophenyl)acetyl-CoA isomerase [Sphingobium sp. AEW010]|nr:2-(1,2-epoxy-1,2-dihydrophenyl)acetyl-CoA isomerase [Sphingobium sp. AEW010]TWD23335.1 2-(1,2-epoxy-1,2-dihydrophenyl)acetyl-CoA isomerase [Sphingobium sp. AEW013]TWD25195.1 2-(1,2-epoxy-1,2-dihydrophenyl)acetyl-CoA isomerase [Sphingobium sp. AEW001]
MEHLEFDRIMVDIDDGGFATLTLDDPDNLNSLSLPMVLGISEAIDALRSRHIRALLIRAEGRGFCGGLNLKQRADMVTKKRPAVSLMNSHFFPMLRHLKEAPFPTVCAVNGPAAGIGVTLALMCDVTIAARSAFFVLPFTKNLAALGDGGISWILPRIIGWARAKHMLLFGTRVTAETALQWGMLYDMFEDDELRAKSEAIARDLATGPTVALSGVRRFLWEGLENGYDRQLQAEVEMNNATHATFDYKEALAARGEKRKPQFKGE